MPKQHKEKENYPIIDANYQVDMEKLGGAFPKMCQMAIFRPYCSRI